MRPPARGQVGQGRDVGGCPNRLRDRPHPFLAILQPADVLPGEYGRIAPTVGQEGQGAIEGQQGLAQVQILGFNQV